uniref:NADH dehydrogenase subunit 4L n=1 Tax=Bochrus foveatus TaxID=2969364 RepID=UPI002176BCB0|nr:NADH dehydrogenase subunit 4L [Bochrus foveatus]UUJ37721.1 NADH dehydrogenase subunit 4L [Bochrus foveatus]
MNFYMTLMFMSGLILFCSLRKHLLLMLFGLEFMVIIVFMMFYIFLSVFGFEMYYLLIFLVFSVCEGALGLSILVNLIRSHGNDYMMSFSLLW